MCRTNLPGYWESNANHHNTRMGLISISSWSACSISKQKTHNLNYSTKGTYFLLVLTPQATGTIHKVNIEVFYLHHLCPYIRLELRSDQSLSTKSRHILDTKVSLEPLGLLGHTWPAWSSCRLFGAQWRISAVLANKDWLVPLLLLVHTTPMTLGGLPSNCEVLEGQKDFVIPAPRVSTLRPSFTSIMGMFLKGLQPLSYRCERALEGLHSEIIRDKAGTAIPVVQLCVRQQGWPHCCAHKLL